MSDAAAAIPAGRAPSRAQAGPPPLGGAADDPGGRPALIGHAFAVGVPALLMGLQPVTIDLMRPALPALAADLQAPGSTREQKADVHEVRRSQKWPAEAVSQPTIPKSDRLLVAWTLLRRHGEQLQASA